jgi:ribosomal protein S18 acetylase RimI-like enzyme
MPSHRDDYVVRPMRPDDLPRVQRVTNESFDDHDRRLRRVDDPLPAPHSDEDLERWRRKIGHLLHTDPRGCFVAENSSGLLGAAVASRREMTWILSILAVRSDVQGRGVGRQLLEASLSLGVGCLRSMLVASDDPAALRRYRTAGFDLHPMLTAAGTVPRSALPVVERVRDGSLGDVELMDSVDRRVRDAAHGVDHQLLMSLHRLVVADRATGSGYAYVDTTGRPQLLAATNRRTAADLLWESLASSDPDVSMKIWGISGANQWVLDVATTCRLSLRPQNCLALRGMKPPTPYLAHGLYL